MAHCIDTTRGPRRKEEFVVGLRADRSWPIAHHGCENQASSTQQAYRRPRPTQIHDAARGPGLAYATLRGAVDARRARAGRSGHRARGDSDATAGDTRSTSPNKAGATVAGASMPRVSDGPCRYLLQELLVAPPGGTGRKSTELIAGLVVPRIHWRSERALYIRRSNSRF